MNSYYILKNIHKVGHPMKGEVTGYEKYEFNEFSVIKINLKTDTNFKAVVSLVGKAEELEEVRLPKIGSTIETVIKNHVDDTLYLSIASEDLQQISEYQAFYQFIETLQKGTLVKGIVRAIVPFGLFVDLSYPYPGLVDIRHTEFNGGDSLPIDFARKIQVGDEVQCILSYFRFDDRQIGLGWLDRTPTS